MTFCIATVEEYRQVLRVTFMNRIDLATFDNVFFTVDYFPSQELCFGEGACLAFSFLFFVAGFEAI